MSDNEPSTTGQTVVDLSPYLNKDELRAEAPLPFLSLGELRDSASAVSWLVKGVVPADSIGVVFGGSGTFKSFIALDLALHVAHGLPWLGRRTTEGPVLYIAAEGGRGVWKRIDAWHRARKLRYQDAPMHVVPVPVDLGQDALRVQERAKQAGTTPAFVVIDTLSQTYSGEENSANEVAGYFREIGLMLRATWQCTVAVIHHSGHQATERPRGSSVFRNNVDWMFGVFRDEKEMLATIENSKQKDDEQIGDETFSLTSIDLGVDADGDKITSLVARHLSSAEEIERAGAAEHAAGRGGKNQLLISLLQNGEKESALRKAFYEECAEMEEEARRKAYFRARAWAVKHGYIDIAEGTIVTLKRREHA